MFERCPKDSRLHGERAGTELRSEGPIKQMAKVKLNPVMEQLRGKIGDLVFRRYEDRILVARRPNRDGLVPTAGQTDHRERFRQAAAYAKGAFADPAQKALYEAAGKARRKPAFALAVGDYLNAPVVDLIDLAQYTGQAGQTIIVRAHDDFAVTAVNVTLKDNTGSVIEQGPASLELGVWRYIATDDLSTERPVTIEAVATDRPGNRTTHVHELT